uniref:Retrotransposon gag domain-containing protein n=1 Tax=Leersia perrieri TaxID=77586 RepID=A0A0D9XYH4_9ORYZ
MGLPNTVEQTTHLLTRVTSQVNDGTIKVTACFQPMQKKQSRSARRRASRRSRSKPMGTKTSEPISTPTQQLNPTPKSVPTPIIYLESTPAQPPQQESASTWIHSPKITLTRKPRSPVFKTTSNPEVFHLYRKLRQEPIESFAGFTRRVLQALDQVKPVSDHLALSTFYHGLTNIDMVWIWHRYKP